MACSSAVAAFGPLDGVACAAAADAFLAASTEALALALAAAAALDRFAVFAAGAAVDDLVADRWEVEALLGAADLTVFGLALFVALDF